MKTLGAEREDAVLVQGVDYPGLHGTEGGAACRHERGARRRRRTAGGQG